MNGKNLAFKLMEAHSESFLTKEMKEIPLMVDQVLMPDDDVLVSFLQFESIGIPRIRVKLAVCYIDHNTLQVGPESANDHAYFRTFSAKYGLYLSKPGNGICHQLHLERFGVPGESLLGADSHSPTAGALGMLAFGAGGLDVVAVMAGGTYDLAMPKVMLVKLNGELPAGTSAKDVALEVLKRLGVRGGVGKILEYGGIGIETLSVPERATIANLGTEAGAMSTIFPSDPNTRSYLKDLGREGVWKELRADPDAYYDETMEIDLSNIEPLVAMPHSPGNVKPVSQLRGMKVDQVIIGGCANSSVRDLTMVAEILQGKKVPPQVSAVICPGSRRVLYILEKSGITAELIKSGVRMIEPACGPCIGLGQTPPSEGVTLRTFNRNFKGRCGTPDAHIYLVSPETAAASALTGEFTDPRTLKVSSQFYVPEDLVRAEDIPGDMIIPPAKDPNQVTLIKGPNVRYADLPGAVEDCFEGKVLLKAGDDITTDQIIVAGAKGVPLRSNIPALSDLVFETVDPTFAERAKKLVNKAGVIIAGENYGQGSARDHAVLCPKYLGLQIVIAKSFARIHISNLINFGIIPLLMDHNDYDPLEQEDILCFKDVRKTLREGACLEVVNLTKGSKFKTRLNFSRRQREILLEGGLLNLVKKEIKA